MNYPFKKKRFIYNAIVPKKTETAISIPKPEFPDDFNAFTSQPSKRIKLTDANGEVTRSGTDKNDYFQDLIDDDFDFIEAANEIDQIEIAASQQASKPGLTKNRVIEIDPPTGNRGKQFNPFSQASQSKNSTLSLKIPKRKPIPPANPSPGNLKNIPSQPSNLSEITTSPKIKPAKDKTPTKDFSLNIKNTHSIQQKQLSKAQEQVEEYRNKLVETERKFHSKDGEIKILRESMRKLSEEEKKHKETIVRLENDLKTQQTEKEGNLFREVQKLKTQLEFKEREIQDALEKQKKMTAIKQSPKRVTTPVRNSAGSGFDKDTKLKSIKTENVPNLPDHKKIKCSIHRSKLLGKCLRNNFRFSSVCCNIITNAKIKTLKKSEAREFNCTHDTQQCGELEEIEFYRSLQLSLEMIENDEYFVTDFISKLSFYLNGLQRLLTTSGEKEGISKMNNTEDEDCHISCKHCDLCYEHGLKSLIILYNVCKVSQTVRKYLLQGLAVLLGNKIVSNGLMKTSKNIEIENKEYFFKYPSSHILTENLCNMSIKSNSYEQTDFENVIQFWTSIHQLKQVRTWDVEENLFLFYSSLFSAPIDPLCDGLVEKMKMERIVEKYLQISSLDRILHVLHLLRNCVNVDNVKEFICLCTDRCPLLIIYNTIINMEIRTCLKLSTVFRELVCFLSSFIASKQSIALHVLLESDCQCSNEIIECMITILFDEFKYLQQKVFLTSGREILKQTKERLSTFRQGMSLLCTLCSNDKSLVEKRSAVESNYIYLLVGSIKMYRKIPSVNESEVLALEDLLDMDQYIELDEENIDSKSVSREKNGTANG